MRSRIIVWSLLIVCICDVSPLLASGGNVAADPAAKGQPQHLVMMIIYATIALGFSFLCSIAEAVVLSISPSYIVNKEREQARSAPVLRNMKTNIDRSLAAILTLNTIAHTVGAGGAGAEAANYFGQEWIGVSMAVLTLLILFLSEIIPKTIGAVYWRRLAPLTSYFVRLLTWSLYPLIWISEQITKLLTGGRSTHAFNRDEFTAMADIGAAGGHLDVRESRILRNLFRFPTLQAEDIMTPRTVVFALQQDQTAAEVLAKHNQLHFSRIPIYGENRDDITGFVLKTDLLSNAQSSGKGKLRDFRREIRAIEENTPLSQTLEELLDNRAHILLVVDKYGGMQGLVTLEDVVETLIGIEIVDEADEIDDMRRLARQKWEERMKRIGIDVRQGPAEPDPLSKEETAIPANPDRASDAGNQ